MKAGRALCESDVMEPLWWLQGAVVVLERHIGKEGRCR